ncbi:glycosyltransferase family 2 protein [Limosilactobacillus reuteri]|uniref:glycosyltransferase family 2 protein n=1 Tax=Limosilactobacillus reuteri TaxID=1598 RepID=UPI00207329EF|nr:glycosyltransferase family 2 protein [Limosilactobacillus reuteri]
MNKLEPVVSVIVPTYNSERTIEKCIESLLGQTLPNFDIYVIDDGSTDKTFTCLKKFDADHRVHIYTQANKGVSSARNNGLKRVRTKYITFVDSDDFVSPTYLERLVHGIESRPVEMAICNIPSNFMFLSKNTVLDSGEVMNMLLSPYGMGGYLWNKIFESKIIRDNDISFNEDFFVAEDLIFCEQYLVHAKKVNLLTTHDYHYNDLNGVSKNIKFRENNVDFYLNYFNALKYILSMETNINNIEKNLKARMCDLGCDIVRIINLNKNIEYYNVKKELLNFINQNKGIFFESSIINDKRKILLKLTLYYPILVEFIDRYKNR